MNPESIDVTVVFLGKFSPAHTLLTELRKTKSLGTADLAEAYVKTVVDGQVAEVRFPWGALVVGADRLQVSTQQVPYIRASDLILKYVREIEPTARARALGINVRCIYRFLDGGDRDAVGVRLVPPLAWGSWGKEIEDSLNLPVTDASHGGMRTAVMRQGRPGKREGGWFDAKVQATGSPDSPLEVTIETNDHYEFPETLNPPPSIDDMSARLVGRLENEFDISVLRSLNIANGIVTGK